MAYGADSLLVTAVVLPFLSIIAVFLRFYVRPRMRHTYIGIDDWLLLFSVLLVCGQGLIQILGSLSLLSHETNNSESRQTKRWQTFPEH